MTTTFQSPTYHTFVWTTKKNFKVIFLSFTHWWVKVFYLCRAV